MNEKEGKVTVVPLELIEFDVTEKWILEFKAKYRGIEIIDNAGYEFVRKGIAELRTKRVAVENKRKYLKAPAIDYGKRVDSQAKGIIGRLRDLEVPLVAEKEKENQRREKIREERAKEETVRVDSIMKRIDDIRALALYPERTSEYIGRAIQRLADFAITDDLYMEFVGNAEKVIEETHHIMKADYDDCIRLEKEDADRKAEGDRLEALRKKQEAERKKLDEEVEKIKAEKKKIRDEREKIEADKRKAKEERDRKEKEERDRKEKIEADKKRENDRKEKEIMEKERIARQDRLAPDKDKLIKWARELMEIRGPKFVNDDSLGIVETAEHDLHAVANWLMKEVDNL